ncbi:MAG: PEP/pyruvate-binding domain-containing protein, partial [Promethearchaeota archaeon]
MTSTETNKYIYNFTEGKKELKNLLGGKGANLGEMTNLGLNIPSGFTITTEACLEYFQHPEQIMAEIEPIVIKHLKELEKKTGKKFGDERNPL